MMGGTQRRSIWMVVWTSIAVVSTVGHSWSWWLGRDIKMLQFGKLQVTELVNPPDSDRLEVSLDGESVRALTWNDPVAGVSYVAEFDPTSGKLLGVKVWSGGGWIALLFRFSVYVVVLGGLGLMAFIWDRRRARRRSKLSG